MKNLIVLLGLFFANGLFAQSVVEDQNDTTYRSNVEKPAVYSEGWVKFYEKVQDEISLTYTGKECKIRKDIEIVALLKISSAGELVDVEIYRSNCENLNAIVIAALKKFKKFTPAVYNGQHANSSMLLSFAFSK